MRPEPGWWVRAAERDLAMARELESAGFHEGTAFHCQQAAEKFLKAVLLKRGLEWHRTHSCTELFDVLSKHGFEVPAATATAARKLDLHYIDSRYPNGVGGAPDRFYDAAISSEAVQNCLTIQSFAEKHIG